MMGIDSRKTSALSEQLEQFRTSYASSKIQLRLREANKINSENLVEKKDNRGSIICLIVFEH